MNFLLFISLNNQNGPTNSHDAKVGTFFGLCKSVEEKESAKCKLKKIRYLRNML